MFSDLIFVVSLSISAITLIGSPAYSQASIINKIISFIFNFTVLIMIWIRYTGTMAILPIETGQIIFLNLLMLLLVGLEPYLLSIIQGAIFVVNPSDLNLGMADYASSLYALDIAGLVAIQGFFRFSRNRTSSYRNCLHDRALRGHNSQEGAEARPRHTITDNIALCNWIHYSEPSTCFPRSNPIRLLAWQHCRRQSSSRTGQHTTLRIGCLSRRASCGHLERLDRQV